MPTPQENGLPIDPSVSSSLTSAGASITTGMKQTWQTLKHMLPPWVSSRVGGDDLAGTSAPKAGPFDSNSGGSDGATPSSVGVVGGAAAGSEPTVSDGGSDDGVSVTSGGAPTGGPVEGADKFAEPLVK